uniref:Uncharacterized protein n=1 Tax=Ditylenchus dipsaci TaxID=166011 RepID=A0A915DJ24_9BILA
MSTLQKIDKASAEGVDSSVNIFELPHSNVGVNRSSLRQYLPLTTITREGPYIFRILPDNQFLDANKTWLELELGIEVQSANGEWVPIPSNHRGIGVIQSLGQSFVKQIKISINNVECFDSGVLYAYRSYIQQELNLSNETRNGLFQASGYSKENTLARVDWFTNGRTARFLSKLNFDLANQPNYLLNNTDILITIYRNSDDFLLLSPYATKLLKNTDGVEVSEPSTDQYRLKVSMVRLYAKTVDLTSSLNNAISRHLEKTPAKYALRKVDVRSVFVGPSVQELTHNVFHKVCPRRVIIGFVASDAFSGKKDKSPFIFENCDVTSISVEANGMVYPSCPYKFDFVNGNFLRAFVDMYSGLGQDESSHGEQSCGITLDEFKQTHCFFVIPLTSTLENTNGFEIVRNTTTCIKATFGRAITEPGYQMIVLAEFDNILTINRDRVIASDGSL